MQVRVKQKMDNELSDILSPGKINIYREIFLAFAENISDEACLQFVRLFVPKIDQINVGGDAEEIHNTIMSILLQAVQDINHSASLE